MSKKLEQADLENFFVMCRAYYPNAEILSISDSVGYVLLWQDGTRDYTADMVMVDGGLKYSLCERERVSYGWFTTIYCKTANVDEFMDGLRRFSDEEGSMTLNR